MRVRHAVLLLLPAALFAQDPFPEQTVAYFETPACPSGWAPYEPANGRTIVPVASDAGVLAEVGQALSSGQQPVHQHQVPATFSFGSVGYIAVAGCCNTSLAEGGTVRISPATTASSPLPYVQMLACRKQAAPEPAPIPRGTAIFYEGLRCPAGWSDVTGAHGYIPVGGARTGGAFGGPVLLPREDRKHSHHFTATLTAPSQAILALSGGGQGYARAGTYTNSGTTSAVSSGMPYLQLLQCSKDADGPPHISAVLNGASFTSGGIAPGQIIAIFGTDLGPEQGAGAELVEGSLATTLSDVKVSIDGRPAPLFFAGKTQINAQVPYRTEGSATIQVTYQDQVSNTFTVPVESSAPGLFAYPAPRDGEVIAILGNDLASSDRPIPAGEPFILWATGGGLTNPASADGRPRTTPLAQPILPVTLTVGGVEAAIDYSGAAPGFVGLMQINARLGPGTPSGKVPVVLKIGSVESAPGVNLFVQ